MRLANPTCGGSAESRGCPPRVVAQVASEVSGHIQSAALHRLHDDYIETNTSSNAIKAVLAAIIMAMMAGVAVIAYTSGAGSAGTPIEVSAEAAIAVHQAEVVEERSPKAATVATDTDPAENEVVLGNSESAAETRKDELGGEDSPTSEDPGDAAEPGPAAECPAGTMLVGDECLIPDCSSGWRWNGTECEAIPVEISECEPFHSWDGTSCVAQITECVDGTVAIGEACPTVIVPLNCPAASYRLPGGPCIPILTVEPLEIQCPTGQIPVGGICIEVAIEPDLTIDPDLFEALDLPPGFGSN